VEENLVKTFCSAEDIENLATQGKTELIIDKNTVLTDLARHTADQLGITIVHRSGAVPESAPDFGPDTSLVSGSAPVRPSRGSRSVSVKLGSKPKGCQHGPLNTQQQPPVETTSSNNGSGTVVDQLVGLVKRLGRNES
jgi:hypothetical protein